MKHVIKPGHDARPEVFGASHTVKLLIKNQYGATVYYPHNATAQHFADIAGTKTLTLATVQLIKKLGFTVESKHEAVDL